MYALVYFRANSLDDALFATKEMFTDLFNAPFMGGITHFGYAVIGLLILFITEYIIEYKKIEVNDNNSLRVYILCSIGMLAMILGFGVFDGGQFIYFQF